MKLISPVLLILLTSLFGPVKTMAYGDAPPNKRLDNQKFTLSGYIKDAKSGEVLIGATVFIKQLSAGTTSNVYGFYSLSALAGTYDVSVSYVGYSTKTFSVELQKNTKMDIELAEVEQETKEVVVTADKPEDNIKKVEMSVNKLEMRNIEKMPALLGEVDVIRSIQLLPGVSTVGEGATGFNVRGGGVDQNLVLLDEAPVFSTSHLFGLFSVFNPDAVKDVKLIKGGIPAQYGGRLSSILDVRLKDGNNKKFGVQGGLGLIFSRLTIEGPIKKDKGSFIIAGRRSYGDLFLKLSSDATLKKTQLYFYDLTAKANYVINERNKVFLSGYLGRDVFSNGGFGFQWGNTTTTARWNHLFSDRLFLNATAYFSKYDYQLGASTTNDSFDWTASITNSSFKPELTWFINPENQVTFGAQSTYYQFKPGAFAAKSGGESSPGTSVRDQYASENGVYLANEQKVTERLSLQYGLRYSYFNYLGSGVAYNFDSAALNTERPVKDSTVYGSNQVISQYGNFEPRFGLKFELDEQSSLKASYNRMAQYIHLISNSTASAPIDIWMPSTNNVKPEIADQVAAGYFRNFGAQNDYEFSLELYYKNLYNQVDYIDRASLLVNQHLEGSLLYGKGRPYGAEFYLKKNNGKLTGWISYTLSRTERQVLGISNGDWYKAKMDRPHNLNVVAMYDISSRWSASTNVVYSSGTPATFASQKITFDGQTKAVGNNPGNVRNGYRIPATFRIDLSITLEGHKPDPSSWKTNYESKWVFSVYNLIGYANPFGVYINPVADNPLNVQAYRLSIFRYPIPGLTYNFKF